METSSFPNTEKLINIIKTKGTYVQGDESIHESGTKYRYDVYRLSDPYNTDLKNLFYKAAVENGATSDVATKFFHNKEYSFDFDRNPYKGRKDGDFAFSQLIKY